MQYVKISSHEWTEPSRCSLCNCTCEWAWLAASRWINRTATH